MESKSSINFEKINLIKKIKFPEFEEATCIIVLQDGRIAAACQDGVIRVYDPKNDFHIDLVIGMQNCIESIIQLPNGKLVSASYNSIMVWNLTKNTYNCEYELETGNDITKLINLSKDRFACCNKVINIYSSKYPYDLIKTLDDGNEYISIAAFKDKEVLISAPQLTFWDLDKYEVQQTINGTPCKTNNDLIVTSTNKIILGSDSKLIIFDIASNQIEYTIEDNTIYEIHSVMELQDGTIVAGNDRGCLYQFNIDKLTIKIKELMRDTEHNDKIKAISIIDETSICVSEIDYSASFISFWTMKA